MAKGILVIIKRHKKAIVFGLMVLALILMTFSGWGSDKEPVGTTPKNVSVQKVSEEKYDETLKYRGIITPDETKNYAFLQGGKIKTIHVHKGQHIIPGDILAEIDRETLVLSKNTAAQSVKSLENSVRYAKSHLDALEVLSQNGAVSSQEYDAKKTEYLNLLNSLEIAKNNMSQAEEGIKNTAIYSDMDGYVMELPFKEGEVVGPGLPVVISKGEGLKIAVGVSTEDYTKVRPDSKVLINGKIAGAIKNISAFPDNDTLLYPVDIIFNSKEMVAGDTADVQIVTGEGTGTFIPMESTFNLDGIDYVFVVTEDDRQHWKVNKYQVELHEIQEDQIRVTGLKPGMMVVAEGVKLLKDNDLVKIVKAKEDQGQ